MINKIKIKITTFSIDHSLETMMNSSIDLYELQIIDDYHYLCKINANQVNKIKKMNFDFTIEEDKTIQRKFLMFIKDKILIFSIITSISFYMLLNSRVNKVVVSGMSEEITINIYNELKKYKLMNWCKKPSYNEIKEIEKRLFINYQKDINMLSIVLNGSILEVNYELRPKEIILDQVKGKMYSKYEGIISQIHVSKGNVLVRTKQYVKDGDILVDDIVSKKDEEIYLGVKGYILGYVYKIIEVEINTNSDITAIDYALLEGRYLICKELCAYESIINEKIINSENNDSLYKITISYLLEKNFTLFK